MANMRFCRSCSQIQFFLGKLCRRPGMLNRMTTTIAQCVWLNTRADRVWGGPEQSWRLIYPLPPVHSSAGVQNYSGVLKTEWIPQLDSSGFLSLIQNSLTLIGFFPLTSALYGWNPPLGSSALPRSLLQEVSSDLLMLLLQEPVCAGQTLHFSSKHDSVIFPRICFHLERE